MKGDEIDLKAKELTDLYDISRDPTMGGALLIQQVMEVKNAINRVFALIALIALVALLIHIF